MVIHVSKEDFQTESEYHVEREVIYVDFIEQRVHKRVVTNDEKGTVEVVYEDNAA